MEKKCVHEGGSYGVLIGMGCFIGVLTGAAALFFAILVKIVG